MTELRLKHFGWGREGEGLTTDEIGDALDRYRRLFGVERFDEAAPPALSEIELRAPRITPVSASVRTSSSRKNGLPPARSISTALSAAAAASSSMRLSRSARAC